MINGWKRKLLEEANQIFGPENKEEKTSSDAQAHIDELYRQIGQLKVEKDGHLTVSRRTAHPCPHFLANRSARLGLPTEKPW